MNSVWIFIEQDNGKIAEVSLELVSKGRELANSLNTDLCSVLIGDNVSNLTDTLFAYGCDKVYLVEDKSLKDYLTIPYARTMINLIKEHKPEVVLYGATAIGRDIAPRIASNLKCGLTADCTNLKISDLSFKKEEYKNLLLQIRPAFGGNIIATIISPGTKPQMATVREGVMKLATPDPTRKGEVIRVKFKEEKEDDLVKIIEKVKKEKTVNLKGANIIVAGGAGVGSADNFKLIKDLAHTLGAEVGASRAAVDAGYISKDHQVGQTGTTVRPKLYIACGISGAIQHRAGMDQSSKIIAINNDPDAPIFEIAHYRIVGDLNKVIPMFIDAYKRKSK